MSTNGVHVILTLDTIHAQVAPVLRERRMAGEHERLPNSHSIFFDIVVSVVPIIYLSGIGADIEHPL